MTAPVDSPTPEVAAPAPVAEPAQTEDVNTLPSWAREAITKANREAANYRTQVAELKPKADQFTALEQASMTEAQRLAETAEAARRDAESARSDALRYQIAFEHGIDIADLAMLGTGSQEELTARAQWIAEKNAAAAAAASTPPSTPPAASATPRRPVEQLRPGATPNGAEDNSVEARHARFFGAPATK